jgi:hypothetical protein
MSSNIETALPSSGSKIKCINNTDRPELVLDKVYVVVSEPCLEKMPVNYKRFQPDDFRFIAIQLNAKERGFFPVGIFEVIK